MAINSALKRPKTPLALKAFRAKRRKKTPAFALDSIGEGERALRIRGWAE